MWRVFCTTLSVLQYIVMDLNNVMQEALFFNREVDKKNPPNKILKILKNPFFSPGKNLVWILGPLRESQFEVTYLIFPYILHYYDTILFIFLLMLKSRSIVSFLHICGKRTLNMEKAIRVNMGQTWRRPWTFIISGRKSICMLWRVFHVFNFYKTRVALANLRLKLDLLLL